jgi:light-regulated signal transduction histidine kinase (bacteriophytochrome)
LSAEALEFIQYSIEGANKMSDLIRDILQYSKLEQQISNVKEVDLNRVVGKVINGLKDFITTGNASVHIGQLPTVNGNETMLNELFQNLIENGIKYNKSEKKYVSLTVADKGQYWAFEVKDNGIGFDEQYAQQIFKIFKRLHGDEEFQGTGIGLSICHKVVENHGGKIWAHSKIGEGSTFHFTLPKN